MDCLQEEQPALSGPIPDAISSLVEIQRFEIWYNKLRGQIPDAVGVMSQLRLTRRAGLSTDPLTPVHVQKHCDRSTAIQMGGVLK